MAQQWWRPPAKPTNTCSQPDDRPEPVRRADVRRLRGQAAEHAARLFLERQGYRVEAANVRFRFGELDLVAVSGTTLCVVEVRSHASARFGPAAGSVDWRKQRHLIRAAQAYLQRRRPRWAGNVRFDVVTVDPDAVGQPVIRLITNAFGLAPGG